jgi:hypothetical protein
MVLCVLVVSVAVYLLYNIEMRGRQIRTYSDLGAICFEIDRARQDSRRLTREDMIRLASRVNGGRDAWGHRILVDVRGRSDTYIVVSPGADGRFDVLDVSSYFESPELASSGMWSQDIVFKNGEPLTRVGK